MEFLVIATEEEIKSLKIKNKNFMMNNKVKPMKREHEIIDLTNEYQSSQSTHTMITRKKSKTSIKDPITFNNSSL